MQFSIAMVLVMDKNQTAKEGFESLEDAAARLLRRIEQRADRPAGERPAEIQKLGRQAPSVGGKADEVAAVSAYLIGLRGLGDDKAVVIPANDNNRFRMTRGQGEGWQGDSGRDRAVVETIATPCTNSEDGMGYRTCGYGLLGRRTPSIGEW